MFTKLAGTALTVTALTALALGVPTPSYADSIGATDPSDVKHGVDLRAVHVQNTDTFVRVTLSHDNLRRDPASGAGGAVYLDTDPDDRGPELVFVGGYFAGTDYQLLETEGFGPDRWGDVVDGYWKLRLDFDKDRTVMRMSRGSVGADDVRVAVKVAGQRQDGTTVVDWLGKARSFTEWVERG
jgi:hypothetical protein